MNWESHWGEGILLGHNAPSAAKDKAVREIDIVGDDFLHLNVEYREVGAWNLSEEGARNVSGQVAAAFHRTHRIADPMQD